ncbi:MAG: restriction endonuclease subunit S [Clostridium sp.]|uniref:restriction endonuclease subunit S n=1 Tax=Clostridium sp. TaxID=1506 RepID=UPI0039E8144B
MSKTKESGISWIGTIPVDWQTNKIKYISTLKGRIGWQGLTSEEYCDEGAFLITGTDFVNGGINWDTCVHVPMKRWEEAHDIQIENGDLLITKDGTIGKVAIVDGLTAPTSLNSGVLRISTISGYDRRFLYWVLQSDVFWTWYAIKNAGNSTIQHLYQGDFAEFKYTIPKINEQKIIANFLDKQCSQIDSIIIDLKTQLELLQNHKRRLITETVSRGINNSEPRKYSGIEYIGCIPSSWETKKVKYVIAGIKDGTHGTFDRVSSGKPLLSAKNVFDDGLHISDSESEISEKDFNLIVSNGYPQRNDVLLCCVGTIGRCCVYEYNEPVAFQRSVTFLRPLSTTNPKYLAYCLKSESTLIQEQLLTNKSAQDGLYMGAVKELIIPFTENIDEQVKIVEFLDKQCGRIDSVISEKQKQIEVMQQHKKSLIYEFVTGKKRVKENKSCQL